MNINNQTIVGEIVASDYRTANVFSKYNIDYCCNGNRSIAQACAKNETDIPVLIDELTSKLNSQSDTDLKYDEWPVDLLADFVVQKHHKYVEASIPVLKQNIMKLCNVHGQRHPELFLIAEAFSALANDLITHMKKEELMLFPFIKKLKEAQTEGDGLPKAMFNTVENPIAMMKHEHTFAGDMLQSIKNLTYNYTPPKDACTTYSVTYAKLKEFQDDMFLHIHLENNILFPKAVEMEKGFVE